ncbi:MAG: REP element-mobilizing transposase RayT [Ilumatobacter sp.]|jgi:REP element-mobilizing transposase RayT
MPRRHGLDQSTFFHVFNRGVDRQDIFTADSDRPYFEQLLADTVAKGGVQIHAYSLMSNHFHLLVEADGPALSEAMRRIGRGYAVRYNREVERSGPLFEGRFKSIPITTDEMLMVEGRYVHRNPIDVVGVRALPAYRFSSLPVYVGRRDAPNWLTTEILSAPFDGPESMQGFVTRTHVSDSQWSRGRPPSDPVTERALVDAVCAAVGSPPPTLSQGGRGNDGRVLLATLYVEFRIGSGEQFAERLGFGSAQALRNTASRGRARLARDEGFTRLHRRAVRNLRAISPTWVG